MLRNIYRKFGGEGGGGGQMDAVQSSCNYLLFGQVFLCLLILMAADDEGCKSLFL